MENRKNDYLTAEDLRNRLYHSLRDRGLIDTLKSQLRNNLVTELQTSARQKLTFHHHHLDDDDSALLLKASNSLLADHLRRCQYDYTHSVFLPESGTAKDKIFSTHDLLKLLNISPHSKLYKRLASSMQEYSKKGFLWQFLSELATISGSYSLDTGVQTDLIKVAPVTSLDEKLLGVDDLYSAKRDEYYRLGSAAIEERILSFQRQLEQRYRTEHKLEVARFRDNELARVRLEEKEKCRRELEQARRELERAYRMKYDATLERERSANERLQKDQEIQEKDVYRQRQSLLDEIEIIRQREAEVIREAELIAREKRLDEERLKTKEEVLRKREFDVQRQETQFEQRLSNETAKFTLDYQAKFQNRAQKLEVRDVKLKDDERRISDEKEKILEVKDELREKRARVNELETLLHEIKYERGNATRQNDFLNSKLREVSDYKTVKEDNAVLRKELETVRTRLAEVLQLNERERSRQEELIRELHRPTPESMMIQRDLERARENLKQEQILSQHQKQQMDTRLQEEIDRNRDLLRRYEEQTLQLKEMSREVSDLRQQLGITHQALNNELYRPSNPDRSGLHSLNASRRKPTPADLMNGHHRSIRDYQDVSMDNDIEMILNGSRSRPLRYSEFSDDDEVSSIGSADVVAEAKYRLKNLEKEGKNLERAYQDFQYRLTADPLGAGQHSPSRLTRSSHRDRHSKHSGSNEPRNKSPPVERPISSTPFRGQEQHVFQNNSFNDLPPQASAIKPLLTENDSFIPAFNLSQLSERSDASTADGDKDERREKPRPITVSDLEARPGSPSIVVVLGSRSLTSEENSPQQDPQPEVDRIKSSSSSKLPPIITDHKASSVNKLPPLSLDNAWQSKDPWAKTEHIDPVSSLDDAWGTNGATKQNHQEDNDNNVDWEEEHRQRQEKREREEEDAREREQRELEKLQQDSQLSSDNDNDKPQVEAAAAPEKLNVDPTMEMYMARVLSQKEREKQLLTQATDIWSKGHVREKTPSPHESENEISVAEEVISVGESDNASW